MDQNYDKIFQDASPNFQKKSQSVKLDDISKTCIELGLKIIPLAEDKKCYLKGWPKLGSSDSATISHWKKSMRPAGWGLLLKANGLFCIDQDLEKKGGKIEGPPQLPSGFNLDWINGTYSAHSQSFWAHKGNEYWATHFFLKLCKELENLTKKRLPDSTYDFLTGEAYTKIYTAPPKDFWKRVLSPHPAFIKYLQAAGLDTKKRRGYRGKYADQGRNSKLFTELMAALDRGDEKAFDEAVEEARQAGLEELGIQATIRSARQRFRTKTKDKIPYEQVHEDERRDLHNRLFALGYEVRFNTRRSKVEVGKNGNWDHNSTEDKAKVFYDCKNLVVPRGKITKETFKYALKAISVERKEDPFQLYLEGLPEWDGKNRIESLFDVLFEVQKGFAEMAKWGAKSIFLASIYRTLNPFHKHDEFLILQGPQGCGKSTFLFHLLPDPSFFSETLSFSESSQKILESLLGKVICEVAEFSAFGKVNREKMKRIMSGMQDTERQSYREDPLDYPRKATLIGSTNDSHPTPNDPSGHRRFYILKLGWKLDGPAIEKYLTTWRDQLWSEGMVLYNKGVSSRPPKDLWAVAGAIAEAHKTGMDSFDEAFWEIVQNLGENINARKILQVMINGYPSQIPDEPNENPYQGIIKLITPQLEGRCAQLLSNSGYEQTRKNIGGKKLRVWNKVK